MLDHRVIIVHTYSKGNVSHWFNNRKMMLVDGYEVYDIAQHIREWLDKNVEHWCYSVVGMPGEDDAVQYVISFNHKTDTMLFCVQYGIFDEA